MKRQEFTLTDQKGAEFFENCVSRFEIANKLNQLIEDDSSLLKNGEIVGNSNNYNAKELADKYGNPDIDLNSFHHPRVFGLRKLVKSFSKDVSPVESN